MKMNLSRALSLLLALVVLATVPMLALAATPIRPANTYVVDEANVLTNSTETAVNNAARQLYSSTGAELVVLTVGTTGSTDIADYAEDLYADWDISNAGILLVLSIQEDDYYACYGYAVTKYFEDNIGDTLYNYLEDDFAIGNYDAGVKKVSGAFVEQLRDAVDDLTGGTFNGADDGYAGYRPGSHAAASALASMTYMFVRMVMWLIVVIVVIAVVVALCRPRRAVTYVAGVPVRRRFFFIPTYRRRPPPPPPPPGPWGGPRPGPGPGPGAGPRPPQGGGFGGGGGFSSHSGRSFGGSGRSSFGSGRSGGGGGRSSGGGGRSSFGGGRSGGGRGRR